MSLTESPKDQTANMQRSAELNPKLENRSPAPASSVSFSNRMMQLQQRVGNQAVQQMMSSMPAIQLKSDSTVNDHGLERETNNMGAVIQRSPTWTKDSKELVEKAKVIKDEKEYTLGHSFDAMAERERAIRPDYDIPKQSPLPPGTPNNAIPEIRILVANAEGKAMQVAARVTDVKSGNFLVFSSTGDQGLKTKKDADNAPEVKTTDIRPQPYAAGMDAVNEKFSPVGGFSFYDPSRSKEKPAEAKPFQQALSKEEEEEDKMAVLASGGESASREKETTETLVDIEKRLGKQQSHQNRHNSYEIYKDDHDTYYKNKVMEVHGKDGEAFHHSEQGVFKMLYEQPQIVYNALQSVEKSLIEQLGEGDLQVMAVSVDIFTTRSACSNCGGASEKVLEDHFFTLAYEFLQKQNVRSLEKEDSGKYSIDKDYAKFVRFESDYDLDSHIGIENPQILHAPPRNWKPVKRPNDRKDVMGSDPVVYTSVPVNPNWETSDSTDSIKGENYSRLAKSFTLCESEQDINKAAEAFEKNLSEDEVLLFKYSLFTQLKKLNKKKSQAHTDDGLSYLFSIARSVWKVGHLLARYYWEFGSSLEESKARLLKYVATITFGDPHKLATMNQAMNLGLQNTEKEIEELASTGDEHDMKKAKFLEYKFNMQEQAPTQKGMLKQEEAQAALRLAAEFLVPLPKSFYIQQLEDYLKTIRFGIIYAANIAEDVLVKWAAQIKEFDDITKGDETDETKKELIIDLLCDLRDSIREKLAMLKYDYEKAEERKRMEHDDEAEEEEEGMEQSESKKRKWKEKTFTASQKKRSIDHNEEEKEMQTETQREDEFVPSNTDMNVAKHDEEFDNV